MLRKHEKKTTILAMHVLKGKAVAWVPDVCILLYSVYRYVIVSLECCEYCLVFHQYATKRSTNFNVEGAISGQQLASSRRAGNPPRT